MIINEKLKQQIVWISLFIFALFYYYPTFIQEMMMFDALRFSTINQIENVHSFEYFKELFLKTTNGPQYRPMSFFIYPLITHFLFGDQLWMFQFTGFLFVLGNCFFIYKILQQYKTTFFATMMALIIFLIQPLSSSSMSNDMFPKYQFPLIVLLLGIYLFQKTILPLKTLIWFTLLFLFAITCHEGVITFPAIWIFAAYFNHKKIDWKNSFIIFLPTLIYLVVRFFIFKVPSSGFMKVSLDGSLEHLLFYFNIAWTMPLFSYYFPTIKQDFTFQLVRSSFYILPGLFLFFKFRDYRFLKLIFFSLVVCLPFSLLPNHIHSSRSMWAWPFFSIAIGLFISSYLKNSYFKFIGASIILVIALFPSFHYRRHQARLVNYYSQLYSDYINTVQDQLNELSNVDVPIIKSKVHGIYQWHGPNSTFPTLLAKSLSTNQSYMALIRGRDDVESKILIHHGSFYHISRQANSALVVYDLYNIEHTFHLPGLDLSRSADIEVDAMSLKI